MLDIVGKRLWFLVISVLLLVASVIALVTLGLKPGIDFASGSITTLSFEAAVDGRELERELARIGYSSDVEVSGGLVRVRTIQLTSAEKAGLKEDLEAVFGPLEERGFENVDPVIARETARVAGWAVAASAVGVLLYITWAFRRMPKPLRYGTCAVIALIHDVVIVLGVYSVLGAILRWEVNLMFITGVLAVIGYSVNNTVVVFDRIRENLRRGVSPSFEVVVNSSLVETLGRSLNTSLTTLAVVLSLVLFVGVSIQNFAVVLLIGVLAGAYSSLFVAPHLLVVWESGDWSGSRRRALLADQAREG